MAKYTLSSYEPVELELPKPPLPKHLVDEQIEKMLEPFAEYTVIEEDRGARLFDFIIATTENAQIDGRPAPYLEMQHSLYHIGIGEMPQQFDNKILGIKKDETSEIEVPMVLPLMKEGESAPLTMTITCEGILDCTMPELTDELVAEHFAPSTTVDEFRRSVASEFTLPDMKRTDPQFAELILTALAQRLEQTPHEEDRAPGMNDTDLLITCAIDALVDHLDIQLTDSEITDALPGKTPEQKAQMRNELRAQGHEDEAVAYARREAALKWLTDRSRVKYTK